MAPPNISQCPLCPWPQEEEIEPDAMANLEHVGNCIHEFSLNALPWVQSRHEMTVDQVSVIVSRVEEWLSQAEDPIERTKLEKIEIGDFPPRPDPLPSTNQDEDVVEYGFVESSGGASRAGTRSDIRSVDFESSKSDPFEVPEHKHDVLGARSNPNKYTIGWICALEIEFVAAQSFLDERHEDPEFVSPNDNNSYALGRAGNHNVVIAGLLHGEIGTRAAAGVARNMLYSFPNVRVGLMVGIGGGAPSRKHDIRLGDVVVSSPSNGNSGVLQYYFGRAVQDQTFQMTSTLEQPPKVLRTAVIKLQANYETKGSTLNYVVGDVIKKHPRLRKRFSRPPPSSDMLYMSNIVHPTNTPGQCAEVCPTDTKFMILRAKRDGYEDDPVIHYGLIASANHVMEDALLRDNLAAERDILCFETEAAGLMNHFPCLVIRGVCDYSDSHKNDIWQGYAAMVAAAYARDLLNEISPTIVETEKSINEGLKSISSPRIENYAVGDQFRNFGTGSQNNSTGSGTQVNYNNWSQ